MNHSTPEKAKPRDGNRGASKDAEFNRRDEAKPSTSTPTERDPRPVIDCGPDMHVTVDAMARALAGDPTVFVRDGKIGRLVRRIEGDPLTWSAFGKAALREAVGRRTRFMRAKSETERRFVLPPEAECQAFAERGVWPDLRALRRVVHAPFLRADGTVCQRPGFDASSGLFADYDPSHFASIPMHPTQEDAARALREIASLFVDFPFQGEADRFVPVALLLSIVGREAIHGPVPMTMVTATAKRTGKSKLANLVSIIATGRPTPPTTVPRTDEEWPKALAAAARAASPIVNFDNIENGGIFGHPQLDSVLTSGAISGRVLGSQDFFEAEVRSVFVASGNNPRYGGDLSGRVIPCRLETTLEHPEHRTDFQIPDVEEHARSHRGRLLAAALTILRAHIAAGKPAGDRSLGGFEAWAATVRGAILWSGGADVLETRDDIEQHDEERSVLDMFLRMLADTFGDSVFIARDIVTRCSGAERQEALFAFCPPNAGRDVTARSLGRRMSAVRGRIVRGRKLMSHGDDRNGSIRWSVVIVGGAGP